MKTKLKVGEWFPVAKVGYTTDGRLIKKDWLKQSIKHFDLKQHIPYWTRGHQWGNERPREGAISDLKLEKDILYVKTAWLDEQFYEDIQSGKYPHVSIELYPKFTGVKKETIGGDEIETYTFEYQFTGVAAISRNAAFPEFHTVELENKTESNLFIAEKTSENGTVIHLLSTNILDQYNFQEGENKQMTTQQDYQQKQTQTDETYLEQQNEAQTKTETQQVETQKTEPQQEVKQDTQYELLPKVEKTYMDAKTRQYNFNVEKYNEIVTNLKRNKEDLQTAQKKIDELQSDLEHANSKILEQDFVITVLDKMARNQITEADLELEMPEGIRINQPSDYLKYSQLYKNNWEDEKMRSYIKKQWEKRDPIQIDGTNLGFEPIGYNSNPRNNLTEEEMIYEVASRLCGDKGIKLNSDMGTDVKLQVGFELKADPEAFKKKYFG